MQTDQISHILSRDPMLCPYDVVAKTVCQKSSTRTRARGQSSATHMMPINRENIGSPCTWTPRGTVITSIRMDWSRNTEFMNFMNEHCSEWAPNDRTLQSPMSTVCGQYCVAFLLHRCRNVSMDAFTRLFTTDLVANDCRLFDWVAAVNKK